MTINELISALSSLSEDEKELQIYACNLSTGDNMAITSISPFDENTKPSKDNVIGLDFKTF